MLKKAAAMFLLASSIAMWMGCVTNSSRYLYAALPTPSEIVAYREDPNSGVLTVLAGSPITAGPAVQSLVIHPSKKFLYAANSFENDISLFAISSTGALTEQGSRTLTGTTPTLLSMDKAGQFLYSANVGSGNISSFSIDASTGSLSQVTGSPFAIGTSPLNMVLAPSGNILYVTSAGTPGTIEICSFTAGVLTQVQLMQQGVGTNPYGLAIDPSGGHLYLANSGPDNTVSEYAINSDGTLKFLATIGGSNLTGPTALLIDNSGKYLYAANTASANLAGFSIASNGSLSLLATNDIVATNASPSYLVSDPSGKYIFVGSSSTAAIQSFSLDSGSGTLSVIASYSVGSKPTSIAVTP